MIDSIIPYIISLNDKINKMENRMNILENKVNELFSIKEEYSKLKKENIEKNNMLFEKSSIIKKDDENTILSWLDKKPSKFNLLLDSKIDGDSTTTFYQKRKNKGGLSDRIMHLVRQIVIEISGTIHYNEHYSKAVCVFCAKWPIQIITNQDVYCAAY